MKNFRKVLALVLVVATLFSFASIAGAKTLADYTDADKVTTENYKFAVDVLSGLEILNGYEDDTFKPTNTITRAEMAKMIAVLANAGDDNVDKLYAAACDFADVDKVNDWFASYVSYCAYTGIVAGRSATTFDPYGKVTGLETAKMLLVVMGMDAAEQGYVGANWKINVLRDAQNFGLLEGFAAGYSVDAAITREEAAMMMLNALKSQVIVGVLSENIVKVTNAVYTTYAGITLKDAEHEGFKILYGNVIVAPITLAEALYEGRLEVDFVRDCYGRPASQWTLIAKNGKVVFEGMLLVEPIVATDYKGEMDLDEVLEDEVAAGYEIVAIRNGFVQDHTWEANPDGTFSNLEKTIGKGTLVEVYVSDVGGYVDGEWNAYGFVTIVIIDTFIGKINYIDLADNEFSLIDTDPEWAAPFQFENEYGFTAADEGKVVLFWLCQDLANRKVQMHDCEIIEPTVAVVTDSTWYANGEADFVADGKTYEYAYTYVDECIPFGELRQATNGKFDEDDRFGFKNDIYTDKYGYVMAHELTDTWSTEYAVALGNSWVSSDFAYEGDNMWVARDNKADLIYFQEDTTPVTEETTFWFNMDVIEKFEDELTLTEDILLEISYDEYGNAIVTPATVVTDEDGFVAALNKGKCDVDSVLPMVNSKTQYIVRVPNYTDKGVAYDYKYFNGLNEVDASYVANEIQYFTTADGRYITYMFLDATFAKETNRAFILSEHSQRLTWSEGIGHVIGGNKYNAVINGEEAIVIYSDLFLSAEDYPVLIKSSLVWVGMTIDGLPVWAASEEDADRELEFCTFCEIKIVGGVMTWLCNDTTCDIESHKKGGHYSHDEDGAHVLRTLLGATVDEKTVIVIAWPTTAGYTFEKITEADFYEFAQKYGWAQVKAYAAISSGYCSELILVVEDIGDSASDATDDNVQIGGPIVDVTNPEEDVFDGGM